MAAGIVIWSLGTLYCGAQAAKRIYARLYGKPADVTPAEKELEEKAEELLLEAMTPPRSKFAKSVVEPETIKDVKDVKDVKPEKPVEATKAAEEPSKPVLVEPRSTS